jgi:DNA polymerase I-like protein with 3'-5' exonuclease and polymerase domains
MKKLEGRYTYAVRCIAEKPNKKAKDACYPLFRKELLSHSNKDKPIMIFALGPVVLQSLGVKVKKYADAQGKFHHIKIGKRNAIVFASFSKRQLPVKSGYFEVLRQHIELFMLSVANLKPDQKMRDINPALPLKKLIKKYVFPKTLDEVREIVEEIVMYSEAGKSPDNHPIALDTETNTLYPHRKKLKLLNLLVSWAPGKSVAIAIEHDESPWTLKEVFPYINQLLQCSKPKVFHNAKFDLKVLWAKGFVVNRYSWDTMIGEHLLAEDKRGFYGLKSLTKTFLPEYSGYEDELGDIRHKEEKKLAEEIKSDKKLSELKGAKLKLAKDDGFATVPLKDLNEYGAVDADVTRRMCSIQRYRIEQEDESLAKRRAKLAKSRHFRKTAAPGTTNSKPLINIMYHRAVPATKTLAAMEAYGMAVDSEYVDDLAFDMDGAISESKIELATMVPPGAFSDDFNPNSPAHLRRLFFIDGYYHPDTDAIVSYNGRIPEEDLRLTDSGVISTDAAFLRMLKSQYNCRFAEALLKYRAVNKARGTFVENIRVLTREDGRMHTSFNITGTATGRLSSSDENMQNVPLRIGKHNLKKIFVPTDRETQVIVNADAKAAEVRLYAAYSRDKNLIKALEDGMDPHSFFAATVYNPAAVLKNIKGSQRNVVLETIGIDAEHDWTYEDFQNREDIELTDKWYGKRLNKLRKNIKRVVFGILYGASKNKISAIVGIPNEQAQAIIDVLFRMFPTIPKYINQTKDQVNLLGVVETFLGRRRRFDTANLTHYLKAKAERQAVNFKIQSTSSDIVLGVLCEVDNPLRDLGGRLLITVHDSLVFELPKKYVSQMPDFIHQYGVKNVAKEYPWLPVPFSWDVEVGPSYGELQGVDRYLADHPVKSIEKFDYEDYEDNEILNDLATA